MNCLMSSKKAELLEVLVDATRRLDIEMFKEFSVNIADFKNNKKQYFISDLAIAFTKLKESGDTFLVPEFGNCESCNKGCTGYLFIGNRSRNYIRLIFQTDGSEIIDMGECCDFKPINKLRNLNQRIYIHSFNDRNSEEFIPF